MVSAPNAGARATLGVLGGALALVGAAPASACSVAFGPGYDPVRSARLALTGTVTKVRVVGAPAFPGSGEEERYMATIRVRRVYKGETGRTLRIRGSTSTALCGFGRVRVGERFGLVLRGRRSPYAVGIASRVTRAQLEAATGGRSHRPGA